MGQSVQTHLSSARARARATQGEGVHRAQISAHPKILGHELSGSQGRRSTPRETERLAEAVAQIRKARFLPVSWSTKKAVLSAGPLAKVCWGWGFRLPQQREIQKVQSAVIRSLQEPVAGSKWLRHLLRGHQLHMFLRITVGHFGAAWRQTQKRTPANAMVWTTKGFPGVLNKCLRHFGWSSDGPWHWSHPALPPLNLHKALPKLDWCLHNIRESARRLFWERHHDRNRRDSFHGQRYNADACRWARRCADKRCNFAILSGAAVSPACLARMKSERVDEFCPRCSQTVAPTWLHLAWECTGLQSERESYIRDPSAYPEDLFHKRTGWPRHVWAPRMSRYSAGLAI